MTPGGQYLLRLGRVSLLWRPRALAVGLGALVLALGLALLLLGTGTMQLSPAQVLSVLSGSGQDPVANRILQYVRLPRLLTAACVGAALGMAGAAFQSISRNALGSPDVIGFTTGAATGAIALLVFGTPGAFDTAAAAVATGMLTALAVLVLSGRAGAGGGYRLVLIGIGVGAVLTGLNTLLLAKGALDRVMSAQLWLAGLLNARNWGHVWIAGTGLMLFAPVLVALSRRLAVLEMGEDMARQLGLPVASTRILTVVTAVGLTSLATAAAGPIAFIALATPQIARALSRSSDVPMVTGALCGAVLMLAADLISQAASFCLVMPIGLVTGSLGGAYLLLVLTRRDGLR